VGTLPESAPPVSAADIRAWLVAYLSSLLEIPEGEVDVTLPFEQFGLDSAAAVAMTGDLAKRLDVELDPNLALQHRTIEAVSAHISERMRARVP
jgi:acyl carrier protein